MEKPIPIYQGQDFYVPQFEIKIGPRKLEQQVVRDILSVKYEDSLDKMDSFMITINNWDEESPTFKDTKKRKFKYSDSKIFDPGSKVELKMGYFGKDNMRLMIRGEITDLKPSFPQESGPTLVINGVNVLHKLKEKGQRSDRYENLTDSKIAERIGKQLNVKIETPPEAARNEEPYSYILQDNQFDIVFLMERARRVGYDLFVKENGQNGNSRESTLIFGPSTSEERPTYELIYGASLLDFTPTLTTANQVGKVTVRSWDRKNKRKIEHTATRKDLKTKGVGTRGRQADLDNYFGDREEVITDIPVESKQEAKRLATEKLEDISKDMITATGNTVGLPDLRAGSIVCISGLGERFSGRYFVTSTTHTIDDSGYKTSFNCRREEKKDDQRCQ